MSKRHRQFANSLLKLPYMDTSLLMQIGLSEVQSKIYLYLIKQGLSTPSQIAAAINENRTTVYSAIEKLEKLSIISKKNKGKISAYAPNHPSVLESIAEKSLRSATRRLRNLESNLPSLINFYNEYQDTPGASTFYGKQGIQLIWDKIIATKQPIYFVRSKHDNNDEQALRDFRKRRVEAGIVSHNITPSEFSEHSNKEVKKWNLSRTLLPPDEYDSPVEIDIFGDYVAFINYSKDGMSTIIESPEIAEAMRQFFLFSRKYIRKATDQSELDNK